jgi:DNA polymerase-3 subunit delta'
MSNKWDGIYGQQKVIKILEGFLNSDKKPQALIFNGSDGVGKDFVATRFSFLLNLNSQEQIEHINNRFTEPLMKYIFPTPKGKNETKTDGTFDKLTETQIKSIKSEIQKKKENPYYELQIADANVIKINSIREINKFVSMTYDQSSTRTILISDAHKMNDEAQNALLKTLEEPPHGHLFILTTHEISKLKETILSRCWTLNFQPLTAVEIENILVIYFGIDHQTATDVAPFAEGSIQIALHLIENDFNFIKEKAIIIMRHAMAGKFHTSIKEFNYFLKDDMKSSLLLLLRVILNWLNEVVRNRFEIEQNYFSDQVETLQKFNSKFSGTEINPAIYKIERFIYLLQNNHINLNILANNIIFGLHSITNTNETKLKFNH